MLAASIPQRMGIVFGASAGGAYIHQVPDASQIGVVNGAASYTTGFPPLTFLPVSGGGTPPLGIDFNGLFNQITAWNQWQQAAGQVIYNTAFSTAIGGYPKGALLASTTTVIFGNGFVSTADANTNDPDATPTNWAAFSFLGTLTCGDVKLTYKATADVGWILANDGSIGNASSSATTRANADTANLFALLWANVSNTYAAVQNSAGAPVSRGVSAAADFAANRRIVVPALLGRALIVAGAGSGLTSRALGEILGAETLAILQANLPVVTLATAIASGQGSHVHGGLPASTTSVVTGAGASAFIVGSSQNTGAQTLPAMTGTTPLGGSGTAISLMQPSAALNIMLKL